MTSGEKPISGEKLLHIATLKAPHGVRGLVYLELYFDSVDDLKALPHLLDANGQPCAFTFHFAKKHGAVVQLADIKDCNAAEAAKGRKFYTTRAALPAPDEGEYYHADLLGARVENESGKHLGTLTAIPNYGASDIMEITNDAGQELLLPFNDHFLVSVDVEQKRIVVREPEQITLRPGAAEQDAAE